MKFYLDSEMVNRFSGASVSDNLPSIWTRTGDTITHSVDTNLATTGYYVITNSIVNINQRLTLTANGVHLSFYNCIINFNSADRVPFGLTGWGNYSSGQTNSGTVISGVSGNQSISRTINYFGCTINQLHDAYHSFYYTDIIDTTFQVMTGENYNYIRNGARILRSNIAGTSNQDCNIELSADGTENLDDIEFVGNTLTDVTYFNWGQGNATVKDLTVNTNSGTAVIYAGGEGDGSIVPNIVSESPFTKLTSTANCRYDQSNSSHVRDARFIEAQRINPIFSTDVVGNTKIEGIRLQAQLDYTFTGDNPHQYNSTNSVVNYETNVSGTLGTISPPIYLAFGDVYPVIMTRTAQHTGATSSGILYLSLLTSYSNTIVVRDYKKDAIIDGVSTQSYVRVVDENSNYHEWKEDDVMLWVDNSEVTLTEAVASALTNITITKGSTLLEVSAVRTMTEIFCYIRNFMYQFTNFDTSVWASYNGTTLDFSTWNVDISVAQSDWNIKSTGLIRLTSAVNLTDCVINGDLHFNSGVDSTLTFYNVTVTGLIYNDDSAHTLTINLSGGSILTAAVSGTGNGQTDIQNSVSFTVNGVLDGSILTIFDNEDEVDPNDYDSILFTDSNTSGGSSTYVYNALGSNNVILTVIKSGYEEVKIPLVLGTSNASIDISQNPENNI